MHQARAQYGRNELLPDEGTPLWKLILKQFDDLLVKVGVEGWGGVGGWLPLPVAGADGWLLDGCWLLWFCQPFFKLRSPSVWHS